MPEPGGNGLDFSYDSFLSQVPEALRSQIEPAFKNYSEGIQKSVNDQLGQYEDVKPLIEAGWEPSHLAQGVGILGMLNSEPERVLEAMLQEYPQLAERFQQQQQTPPAPTQQQQQQQTPENDFLPPEFQTKFSQMEEVINLLVQGFQQDRQQRQEYTQQQQELQELNQFTSYLDQIAPEDKYPRHFILSYVAQGLTPEQAVQEFSNYMSTQGQQQNRQIAPIVAPGSGGGTPTNQIDTSKLDRSQRANLIAQYLQQANQQSG